MPDFLLLESGDFLLQEDGSSKILLEEFVPGAAPEVPGMEYTWRADRLHYTWSGDRLHFTAEEP